MKRVLWPLLAVLVLLGAWEVYVDAGGVDPSVLAAPHQIAASLWTDRSLLWSALLITGQEVLLGLVIAIVAGTALATLIHVVHPVRRALYPVLVASQAVPVPALAIPFALWFGIGIGSKVAVTTIVSFFAVVVATLDRLAAVDPEWPKLMRSFDANRWQTLRYVELPAALPGAFTGAKIGAAVAVIGAVIGEMGGINDPRSAGLGYQLTLAFNQILTARAWAIVVVLSLFSILLFALMSAAERLLTPWSHQSKGIRS
jgi:NitT/TauT family transport system permease protein/putative hydroxymethylpyrimidine transport system permease protein